MTDVHPVLAGEFKTMNFNHKNALHDTYTGSVPGCIGIHARRQASLSTGGRHVNLHG